MKQDATIAGSQSPTHERGGDSCPASCSPSRFHLDLFSGIGGFALAARWTGWNTIAFAEIDTYASKLLAQNFPGIPNLGDIRNVRGIPCDLITGGFPCQPYSYAGKRGGATDDRALWPEMLRVIAESKPRWVLGENVPGIITLELDKVLSDLESLGYSAWPIVVPACALDAQHRRDRVWILAHADSGNSAQGRNGRQSAAATRADNEPARPDESSESLADAESVRGKGQRESGQQVARTLAEEGIPDWCRETSRAAEWESEPAVARMAHGIPNRVDRLKGLGNAIVPQVAAALMREMTRMENAALSDARPKASEIT